MRKVIKILDYLSSQNVQYSIYLMLKEIHFLLSFKFDQRESTYLLLDQWIKFLMTCISPFITILYKERGQDIFRDII